jgi:hypothetical protein
MAVVKRKKKKVWQSRQQRTELIRNSLLNEAKRVGVISNERACEVGGLQQSWYHLNALVVARKLKRAGYNQWMPVRR